AIELLALALENASNRRRVIFFCGCAWPKCDGVTCCHRDTVADLLLGAARSAKRPVEVVEWPGGDPAILSWKQDSETLKAMKAGRSRLPVEQTIDLARFGGLAWGTILQLATTEGKIRALTGH